jgi:hypothetical protein
MKKRLFALAMTLCACMAAAVRVAAQHEHSGNEAEKIGTVEFPTSCNPWFNPISIARSRCSIRSGIRKPRKLSREL